MSSNNHNREEIHKTIWDTANELRGAVDGWSFKAYVLGTIFYRYISENLTQYINQLQEEAGIENSDYANMSDEEAMSAKAQMVAEKGYFILPSQLFCNVCKNADTNKDLNETLSSVFKAIEGSANGTASEDSVKGLFNDYIVDNPQLGASVVSRNKMISKVLKKVSAMKLESQYSGTDSDTFGDAYEFLMKMYASNAGKSGGEFFTPQEVSQLLVKLCRYNNSTIEKVYDPACGSGSLLLQFARYLGEDRNKIHYWGQEINPSTYNLCRSNMFLHNINYDHFHIGLGDTLTNPMWMDEGPFDAIVSNPPYALKWAGKDNALLMNDIRFSPAGVLAPKSAADLAFVMHILYNLSKTGTAAIVEFPGVLYRTGVEQKIREYLVKNNYIDTIIQLPANLFFGVGIATCIIVLKRKSKVDENILFINASKMCVKDGNKNRLREEDINTIYQYYEDRKDVQYVCKLVDIKEICPNDKDEKSDCNLSVSSYVEEEDKREKIDIKEVNKQVDRVVNEINDLREDVISIVNELGEEEL